MKTHIKDLGIPLDIKAKGLEIQVNENSGRQLGDLYVTNTGLTWCKGKKIKQNGKKITWAEFAAYMNAL